MAACISRGPKTTSNQHTVVATHTNGSTQQQQYNQIIKIYTEWGNHYLEKARFKKLIQNLQSDLTDGVLLADVVEAVCGQKVADINRKPKTPMNMVENIVNCLTLLERIGVALDGITAKDVREGNLKTTLGLFFALSKYKQQQKQRQATQSIVLTPERQQQKRQHLAPPSEDMKQSKLPSPHYNLQSAALAGAGTSIPTPISQRQSRALAPGLNSLKCSSSNNSSRSASPSHSFIPTPKSGLNARSSLNEKQLASIRSANKIPAANCSYNTPPVSSVKNPMIDKAKGPNVKEKNKSIVGFTSSSINSAKRTSSSSGVSSTRSERSDSSNSTCNDVRPTFSDQKDNNVAFTVNEVKPMLRKKVVVKPTENRAVKFPSKANNPLRIEEKPNTQDTSNTKEDSKATMNESSRLSGSGIPKPTAAVKGTAKPTNSVAPMIVKPETDEKPSTNGIEEITEKKEGIEKPKPESGNHSKQSSIGEEEDTLLNIKPMEPMLRGYKRGIVLPHRVVPVNGYMDNQQRHMNGYQSQQYHYMSRFDIKKGAENEDYEVTSGYVSDGDVLQSNGSMNGKLYSDVDGGYMSEGGAQFYERYSNNLEMKLKALKKSEASKANNLSSISGSQNNKQPVNDRVHSTDVLTALSTGSPLHKFGNKLNGRGPGPDEGPISPPEPTPTHAGSYSTSYRASPPHMSPPEPTPVVYRVIGARSHIKKSDNSQQTDNTSFSRQSLNNSSGQWKKYTEAELNSTNGRNSAVVNPQCSDNIRIRDKRSPSAGPTVSNTNSLLRNKMDKRRTSSTSSGTGSREELAEMEYYNGERKSRVDGKNKVRGVPSSFGYVKRSTNTNGKESRTAQVSAVPRTKVKVSGGTQTDMKSYSLSSTAANQLSQCVRERIMMGQDTMQKSPARSQNAHKPADRDSLPGSLSDSTYTDLQIMSNQHNSWFRHGSPYTASLPARTSANAGLIDADSIESLPAQLHHRASLTNTRFLSGTSPSTSNVPARLSRSNSIRSTKSEKLYPSMLQRSEELEPLYSIPYGLSGGPSHMHNCSSQDEPPSPTPSHLSQGTSVGNSSRYHYAASPSSSNHSFNRNSPYMNFLTKMNSKEDDMHGSAMSLVSTASSSLYSTPEDKQAQEMRRLKKDLSEAQQKVHSLTSQLSTNAHVVSAFEKSLSNMTQRLQQLTASAEKKDSELTELRQTIDALRKQSGATENATKDGTPTHNNCSPSLARRHTINTMAIDSNNTSNNISRQLSTDSVSSLVSMSSACSMSSGNQQAADLDKNKKKGGWLRSSFSKAFSRSKKNRNGSLSDVEDSRNTQSDMSAPSSPLLNSPHPINGGVINEFKSNTSPMKNSHSSSALYENNNDKSINDNEYSPELVVELKKQLREKDLVLTDIRLEALSSAHQLESLKDTVIKMRNEMLNLKQDNERLQRIVTSKSLTSSQSSLQTHDSMDRRYSTTDVPSDRTELDMMFTENSDVDAKKVAVWVFFGAHGSYNKYVEERNECPISLIPVSTKTNWEALDNLVFRAFKEYLDRIDPNTNLGLSQDSIWSYHVGEIVRYKDSKEPELLPCGYLVGGSSSSITVCLKGALHSGSLDALAFEMLIPKAMIQRYITLLAEHRKIMLCGPTGTGKTYLANKLAEYLLYSDGKEVSSTSVVNFSVDEKSSKDLRQYLLSVAEQCESRAESNDNSSSELPSVIILDNLHQAGASLNEILNSLLNLKNNKFTPYVIGTLNQSTYSSNDLQLHHNFRWILCANHLEPVKGFLSRYLRRRLIEIECKKGTRNPELWRIIEWIPKVQHHLNQFLETHASSDVTIGPKLFMSCPMEVDGSQVWFTDLWNYSLVPYLHDAVKDGLQLHGKRAPWEDPTQFIIRNYPWIKSTNIHGGIEALMRLRPEDVGYEVKSESDPLLNMLMTLQEAANYTSSSHTMNNESAGMTGLTTNCNNSTI